MAKQGDGRQDERLVTPDMLLPDMVAKFPVTRQVLDKNGLKGCGGPTGPCEPVAWFARLHNVPLQQLLDELNEAARQSLQGGETTVRFEPTLADTIYQPYFTAAAFLAVVFGALWGAVSLAVMGITGGMQFAVPYGWLLAHGQTMLGGFVVLMAMGFSFQAFPRFKHSELQLPHLALAALPLLLLGIALQTFAHFFVPPPIFQTAQPVVHRSFAHWSFAHWSLAHWSLVIGTSGTFLEKLIWAALEGCYDPEIPDANIVELGLVYGVRWDKEKGVAEIRMTLTSPHCPVGDYILEQVRQSVGSVPAVREVRIDLTFDPPWSLDRIKPEVRQKLGLEW